MFLIHNTYLRCHIVVFLFRLLLFLMDLKMGKWQTVRLHSQLIVVVAVAAADHRLSTDTGIIVEMVAMPVSVSAAMAARHW